MPLPSYATENDFRKQWIAPFLSKLGYILVNNIHGSGEQGKDFFFADYDLFEHRRFYAVQAKLGNIGAGDVELDKLLNQVRRCFTVRLRFHKEADEKRVSGVYIMASGSISREGREYISDWCKEQAFGENVYYLDGDTLDRLDKHSFQRIDRSLRNQLIGAWHECEYNTNIIASMKQNFELHKTIFDRNRYTAIEQLLASPPADEVLSYDVLHTTWQYVTRLNRVADYHLLPMSMSDSEWHPRVQLATKAWDANLRLRDSIVNAVKKLDDRYTINIEIVDDT